MNGSLLGKLGLLLLASRAMVGCAEPAPAPPPPLPATPTLVPVPAEAEPVEAYAPADGTAHEKKPGKSKPAPAKQRHAASTGPVPPHASAPTPLPPADAPAPSVPRVEAAPTPAPAPASGARPSSGKRVSVPRTANVHVEFPAGLQADLDADPRMQSWVDKVIPIIDGCHARDRSARGSISARITMHENDRPDADILSLPGPLSGVVACATGSLMRVKMPLFTGREGTRYDVRIVFD